MMTSFFGIPLVLLTLLSARAELKSHEIPLKTDCIDKSWNTETPTDITMQSSATCGLRFTCKLPQSSRTHTYATDNNGLLYLFDSGKDGSPGTNMAVGFVSKRAANPFPIFLKGEREGEINPNEFRIRIANNEILQVDGNTGCIKWQESFANNWTRIKARETDSRIVVDNYPGTYIVFQNVRGDPLATKSATALVHFEDGYKCQICARNFRDESLGTNIEADLSERKMVAIRKKCEGFEKLEGKELEAARCAPIPKKPAEKPKPAQSPATTPKKSTK